MKGVPVAGDQPVLNAVRDAVIGAVRERASAGAPTRIVVALSGGRDSIALLDALARIAPEHHVVLSAMHVHHGLSGNADSWAAFCSAECLKRDVPLAVRRAHVERRGGMSLEAAARAARYAALTTVGADFVALAHHADDQAETLLLRLRAQAASRMPRRRAAGSGPVLLRLLGNRRPRRLALAEVDESNPPASRTIRHEIASRLTPAFQLSGARAQRRASGRNREAHRRAAVLDAEGAIVADRQPALHDRAALIALDSRPASHNLLRWFLRQHHLRPRRPRRRR
jgi:tRNA(Ile)-lysidine synthase